MNERVCAVVVTYNRKALLSQCLRALQQQSRPIDEILVVDNASTDGTPAMVAEEFPDAKLLALEGNLGGAGGFHAGMKRAFEDGFDWLWVMDDDGIPAPDCLELLLAMQPHGEVLVPLQQDSGGKLYGAFRWHGRRIKTQLGPYRDDTQAVATLNRPVRGEFLFTFVGPLIARCVVEQIGLPDPDFFIYFDDIEYALRLHRKHRKTRARVVVVPGARFFHDFGGQAKPVRFLGREVMRKSHAPWKLYYETRNYLYTVARTRRRRRETWQYFAFQARWLLSDLMYEPDRFTRLKLRLKAIFDGALGRLGKRVAP